MTLRPYQIEAHDATLREWMTAKSTVLAMATSSGKTVVVAHLCKTLLETPGNRVLFLADREELIMQPVEKFYRACRIIAGIHRARDTAPPSSRVVVGSIATLNRRLPPGKPFTHIISDEAHRGVDIRARIYAAYPEARIVGITATAFRKGIADLSRWYETVAYELGIFDLVGQGYITPIEVLTLPLELDISAVHQKAGDYDADELDTVIEPHYRAVAKAIKQHAAKRTILAFLPLIRSSKAFVRVLSDEGIDARHCDGDSPDRADLLAAFEKGHFQVLSNSSVFSTGIDFQRADCLLNLTATRSRGEYRQRVGRILRVPAGVIDGLPTPEARKAAIAASPKPNALILDFLWLTAKHGLSGPASLIAASEEEEDALSKRIRKSRTPEDIEAVSREVQRDREARLRQALESAPLRTGLLDARSYAYLLHEPSLIDYVPVTQAQQAPVSDDQRQWLSWARVDPATVNSYGHAAAILAINRQRKNDGLLPIFAVFRLSQKGIPNPEKMKQADADAVAGEPLWSVGKKAGTPFSQMPARSKGWWRDEFFAGNQARIAQYPREAEWCGATLPLLHP